MPVFDKSASILNKILVFTVIIVFILCIVCLSFIANNNKKLETLDSKVSTNIRDFQDINGKISKLFNFDTNQICNGKQCIDIPSLIIQNAEAGGGTPYDFKQLLPKGGKVFSAVTDPNGGWFYVNTYVTVNAVGYILQEGVGPIFGDQTTIKGKTRRSTVEIGKLTATNKGDWTAWS